MIFTDKNGNEWDSCKLKLGGNVKKKTIALLMSMCIAISVTGCTALDKMSDNLFASVYDCDTLRQLTIINCITNDKILQLAGKMSVKTDALKEQLEIVVKNEDGTYSKSTISLNADVIYVVEDIDAEDYQSMINYNPKMWIPAELDDIDLN